MWVFSLEILRRHKSSSRDHPRVQRLVAYTKCNRDSYDSELVYMFRLVVFLDGEQKLGVGVCWVIYVIIYYPHLWVILFINKMILGTLLYGCRKDRHQRNKKLTTYLHIQGEPNRANQSQIQKKLETVKSRRLFGSITEDSWLSIVCKTHC